LVKSGEKVGESQVNTVYEVVGEISDKGSAELESTSCLEIEAPGELKLTETANSNSHSKEDHTQR
jgi:hypothetical protein